MAAVVLLTAVWPLPVTTTVSAVPLPAINDAPIPSVTLPSRNGYSVAPGAMPQLRPGSEVFAGMTAQQVVDRLDAAGIANARVNTMADLWGHPQLAARNRLQRVDSPAGELKAFLPPGVNNRFDYRMDPIPAVGEHTAAILRELGYSAEQVAAMQEQGAIG